MSGARETIERSESLADWAGSLAGLDDFDWFRPMRPGKASIAEVISHLQNWDRYLLETVLTEVEAGRGIHFPAFDPFNALAYQYANSGVARERLLCELAATRRELCRRLRELDPAVLERPLLVNGAQRDPHTGRPYSLALILEEFLEHDEHHRAQIEAARSGG
ncbi:DinB family protein [Paenibacillus pasadenensis]|uniref:DinB-like domain-containing protein n=1 Tax=Paenibacillus pasadenensis TaxID=217090 RepID=A0A2N5N024_9BACL|nr:MULTISPECIES: DinB family protein [Paenibacillus]PLT43684.1 hypothetical protein B8V81_2115 [Paenibacillus pasadenensis]QGG54309.1 DinB family protein [Paenibacillus sp. B01]